MAISTVACLSALQSILEGGDTYAPAVGSRAGGVTAFHGINASSANHNQTFPSDQTHVRVFGPDYADGVLVEDSRCCTNVAESVPSMNGMFSDLHSLFQENMYQDQRESCPETRQVVCAGKPMRAGIQPTRRSRRRTRSRRDCELRILRII